MITHSVEGITMNAIVDFKYVVGSYFLAFGQKEKITLDDDEMYKWSRYIIDSCKEKDYKYCLDYSYVFFEFFKEDNECDLHLFDIKDRNYTYKIALQQDKTIDDVKDMLMDAPLGFVENVTKKEFVDKYLNSEVEFVK